jgi:nitrilase
MPRAAVVQMTGTPMNVEATLGSIESFAEEAAAQHAGLIVFPELIVPGYPRYVPDPFPSTDEGVELWADSQRYFKAYCAAAQVIPGPFTDSIGEIARAVGADIVVGVAERHPDRRACLWNTAVVVGRNGSYLGKHRKLVAVMHERLYFQRGGREDIRVFDSDIGRIGLAICFENYHPLYRRALGRLGEEIHCALWTGPAPREVAARGGRIESHRELGVAHALDTGGFVLIASMVTPKEPAGGELGSRWAHSGGSYIVDPLGGTLAAVPDYEEGIAVAELDLSLIEAGRLIWNPFGDDARDDLFFEGARELVPGSAGFLDEERAAPEPGFDVGSGNGAGAAAVRAARPEGSPG